jgi:hypothetical protein
MGLDQKKGRQRKLPARKKKKQSSDVGLRLAEAHHAIAFLPLAAFLEDLNAFEALEDVAFNDEAVGALEALVL